MRKKIRIIFFIIFLSLIACVIYVELDRPRKRKKNFGLVMGEVINVGWDVMNGYSADITYKAVINEKEIVRRKRVTSDVCKNMGFFLMMMNRKMQVVYEKNDIENCDLLLSRKEYREYKISPSHEVVPLLDALMAVCSDYE
jgi:hypothetical protein